VELGALNRFLSSESNKITSTRRLHDRMDRNPTTHARCLPRPLEDVLRRITQVRRGWRKCSFHIPIRKIA
jgi:hypothetical protein